MGSAEGNELIHEEQEEELFIAPNEKEAPAAAEPEVPVSTEPKTPAKAEGEAEEPAKEAQVDKEPEPDSELKKQIARLEKAAKKQDRKIGYLTRKLTRPTPAEKPDLEAPKAENFDTYEEFEDAKVEYKVQKGIRNYEDETKASFEGDDLQQFIDDTLETGRERFSDFKDVAENATVAITKPMLKIMRDSEFEHPEAVAYYLGKNPAEAVAISRMSPIQATRALTRIEVKATAEAKAAPPQTKKVSNAPPPVKPTGSVSAVSKDPEKMSQSEYEEWRQKGGGK